MGKTQSGAVWLDPNKTSPFEFYQYWRNVADADVLKCIRMLTFLPLEEVEAMELSVEYTASESDFVVDDNGKKCQYGYITRTEQNATVYDTFKQKVLLPTTTIS